VLSGRQLLDDPTLARLQQLTTDPNYPEILAIKTANLLAAHFAAGGDARKQYEPT